LLSVGDSVANALFTDQPATADHLQVRSGLVDENSASVAVAHVQDRLVLVLVEEIVVVVVVVVVDDEIRFDAKPTKQRHDCFRCKPVRQTNDAHPHQTRCEK